MAKSPGGQNKKDCFFMNREAHDAAKKTQRD
jgi:hypothetical protein